MNNTSSGESLRFRTIASWVMAIPPRQREALLFGRHALTIPLQKILQRLIGKERSVQFDLKGRLTSRFESSTSEKYFYLRENFEKEIQDFIVSRVEPGMLVFDVGGHIGFMALFFSAIGARVVTFEPSTVNFPRLQRNLSLNPDKHVTAINAGASESSGTALLTDASSMSAISPGGTVPIRLVRLDDVAAEYGIPSFLKIDVEGHAGPVLRGAKKILSLAPAMMVEIHHPEEERDVMAELTSSYDVTFLDTDRKYPKRISALAKQGREY